MAAKWGLGIPSGHGVIWVHQFCFEVINRRILPVYALVFY
jgi:hypothetical protein